MIKAQALQLLQTALSNPNAEFRYGQWEVIDALVSNSALTSYVQSSVALCFYLAMAC